MSAWRHQTGAKRRYSNTISFPPILTTCGSRRRRRRFQAWNNTLRPKPIALGKPVSSRLRRCFRRCVIERISLFVIRGRAAGSCAPVGKRQRVAELLDTLKMSSVAGDKFEAVLNGDGGNHGIGGADRLAATLQGAGDFACELSGG